MKTKQIDLPYKMLIYDIETGLMKARLFRLGEQRIGHNQLDPTHNEHSIICITAKFYGKAKIYKFQGEDAVEQFDKLARTADVCLGKNSDRFDVKHINTARAMQGLKPYPEWMDTNDDLEKQLRKHFAFPSQSLDYISKIIGTGGKEKMEFDDWAKIQDYTDLLKIQENVSISAKELNHLSLVLFKKKASKVDADGYKALKKMVHYNVKDVLDTEAVLVKFLPYVKLRHNAATRQEGQGCIICGSLDLMPLKIIFKGKVKYQQFECLAHNGYAGKCTWYYKKGSHHKTYGKMGA